MNTLPEAYVAQMKRLLGEAGFFAYEQSLSQPVTRALRVNLLLRPDGSLPCPVEGVGEAVPWAKGCCFVEGDARPGLSPLHEGGLFYLQEPSALSAVSVLAPQPGERVLDLCAAPGGKSTQIAGLMQGRGLLVCNEPVPSRAQILSRNVERMGVRNAIVTSAMPAQLAPRFPAFFDRILVDAPCSGEGMFRRQPEARDEWSAGSPRGCADRQLEILEAAAKMLAPGGALVYSTCTFNDTENEGVLARFTAAHPEFALEPFALPGLPSGSRGYVHLYPHEIRGEGHFVSLLRKAPDAPGAPENEEKPRRAVKPARGRGEQAKKAQQPAIAVPEDVLAPGVSFDRLHAAGGSLWALPEGLDDLSRLDGLRVLRTGLLLAHAEGRRAEPDHALAMALTPCEAARTAELDEAQALAYQAGETLELGDLEPGYTLLTLRGVSLGFGKQAGGVMKNHYPKGLRRR
ncbi:MAG: RsmF rRNA methyltransferase first C-terminal domain-containing protein [Candidatus Ventricola sp.]|nr:RsmF rRNA methyltransferase first C-terminal domain-containing protein [Candidatus Ventricola sp.]